MGNFNISGRKPARYNLKALIKSLPSAEPPDARWGILQILLSFAFFFFGLALAILTVYLSPDWRNTAMLVFTIVLFVTGLLFFVWAIKLGYHYWTNHKELPNLVVTEDDRLIINAKYKIVDGVLNITTDKLLIQIKTVEREGDESAT